MLIIGKYYKVVFHSNVYIFKLKAISGNSLFMDSNFYIINNLYYDFNKNAERQIPYLNNKKYQEINIKDIIDYLPNTNLDKIIYLRKQRIKSLLWK